MRRYARTRTTIELAEHFIASDETRENLRPDFNVSPTRREPIVVIRPGALLDGRPLPGRADEPPQPAQRQLRMAKWGLVPSWAKDDKIGNKLVNARVETAASKPSFRSAAQHRRCLVPADGYFEWTVGSDGKTKQPWYIYPEQGVLAMAGLYELWRPRQSPPELTLDDAPDDQPGAGNPPPWLWTFTVLTTTATDELGHLHDRSPLLVPEHHWDAWLDPTRTDAPALLDPLIAAAGDLLARPVSTRVNSVRNNGPELLEAADPL